ncbi:MAG: hypothetical protein CSA82_02390 [Actinobacteria bacterium]|nr:MAG: hypothetical protein CSA82_02390 [Actinomycetota bacterium]
MAQRFFPITLGFGLAAVLVGIIIMVRPEMTLILFFALWGLYALVDGIASLIRSRKLTGNIQVIIIISAILSIVTGIILLARPFFAIWVVGYILGAWLILRGILTLFPGGFGNSVAPSTLRIVIAVFWFAAGILFIVSPVSIAVGLAFWVGLLTAFAGVLITVAAFMTRNGFQSGRPGPYDDTIIEGTVISD